MLVLAKGAAFTFLFFTSVIISIFLIKKLNFCRSNSLYDDQKEKEKDSHFVLVNSVWLVGDLIKDVLQNFLKRLMPIH